ncbi:MAG: Endonuclease/exonuclease/phosphatase [Frankiales bacterium]|nr:Endonuclease/exonuclease/phosphatase [Frankiales bacterium]
MRLVTFNVQSLRGGRQGVIDAVLATAPDVLCLQEWPRFALPSIRLRRFARTCGLVAVGSGVLAGDTAVLVRDVSVVRRFDRLALSRTPRLHRRGASAATVAVADGGLSITVASVHLGLNALERERHAAQLAAWLVDFDQPSVVAGDMNEGPGGAAWQLLESTVGRAVNVSEPTFPSYEPRHTIDTAFVGAGLAVLSVDVPAATASDHRPVVVGLAWSTGGAP